MVALRLNGISLFQMPRLFKSLTLESCWRKPDKGSPSMGINPPVPTTAMVARFSLGHVFWNKLRCLVLFCFPSNLIEHWTPKKDCKWSVSEVIFIAYANLAISILICVFFEGTSHPHHSSSWFCSHLPTTTNIPRAEDLSTTICSTCGEVLQSLLHPTGGSLPKGNWRSNHDNVSDYQPHQSW